MAIPTTEERLGTLLANRYRLESVLASGGMGVLYVAMDGELGRRVAVKMLKPTEALEPDRVARFEREARITAMLSHPNIAAFMESGADEGKNLFFVMELLHGTNLERLLAERKTLTLDETMQYVMPIARALVAAHGRGVIHRDVKPSNIFLSRDASGRVVPKLIDFGIARSRRDDFETRSGSFVGTLGYIAPEQAMNGECSPVTDVWAVAAVLHRCLAGAPPHAGGSVPEVLARLVHEPVAPLAVEELKRSLRATIERALSRFPEDRHQSMQSFIEALERDLSPEGTGTETCDLAGPSMPTNPRRMRSVVFFGLPVLAFGICALSIVTRRDHGSNELLAAATRHVEKARSAPFAETRSDVTPALAEAPPRADRGSGDPKPAALVTLPKRRPARAVAPSQVPLSVNAPERDRRTGLPVATEW